MIWAVITKIVLSVIGYLWGTDKPHEEEVHAPEVPDGLSNDDINMDDFGVHDRPSS